MSKNPKRGYVRCPMPGCGEVCTVHMTGEHRLIESGEPPKNPRNIGKLYYRCPECGNSPNSNKVHSYIENHMVQTVQELDTPPVQTVKESVQTVAESVTEKAPQTSNDGFKALVEPDKKTEPEPKKTTWKTLMPWFAGVFVVVFLLIALCKGKEDDSDSRKLATV